MQQVSTDIRGMAQAQGNDALLSQVLPAGILRRFDVAGGSGNMVAFWGNCHSLLASPELAIGRSGETFSWASHTECCISMDHNGHEYPTNH